MKIAALFFVLLLSSASAAEPRQLLQEGLFEEEANRDLDKASAAYESLIASFDKERQYAATALFRLAEIRAKQNRKEDALALFQRVATEFSTNDPLARLSRERIAALGGDTPKLPGGDPSISDKERQELARLQDLVKNSPDLLNSVDVNVTALGQAARAGWLKAAAFLLDHGADPNSPRNGFPPIHLATTDGRKAMVELLIARGADVNARDAQNRTPLQIAAEYSRLEVARLLLDHGTKVDAVAPEGQTNRTPLQHASANGNIPMVRLLLEKDADINSVVTTEEPMSVFRETPLTTAVRIRNLELVTLLLDRGAKIDREDDLPTSSALAHAVTGKSLPIVQKLIERGAKLANPWLVYQAAGAEEPEILRLLISKGADINGPLYKHTGQTTLHEFAHRSLEITKLLLELGASPKVVNAEKNTPFHTTFFGYPEGFSQRASNDPLPDPFQVAQLLLKHGAPINAQNSYGYTPLHIALSRNMPLEVIEWLLANGADPNIGDAQGKPPAEHTRSARRIWFEQRTLYPKFVKERAIHTLVRPDGNGAFSPLRTDPIAEFDSPPPLKELLEGVFKLADSAPHKSNFHNLVVFRSGPAGKVVEAVQLKFDSVSDPLRHPDLQWGDVVVLFPSSTPLEPANSRPAPEIEPPGKLGVRTVTIRVGDREAAVGLWGSPGQISWAPSMGRIAEWRLSDLVAKIAASEPHVNIGAVKIQRKVDGEAKEWTVDLRPEQPGQLVKNLPARLADGDRLVIPLLPADDPEALKSRRSGVFRVAPGRVFGECVFRFHEKDNAPRFLGELIEESYRTSNLIVPEPDFSEIRIHRLKAGGPSEETLTVNLAKVMVSVSPKTTSIEATGLDFPLQWGDVVEIPTKKDADLLQWRGLTPQARFFLTKAWTRQIFYKTNDGVPEKVTFAPTYREFIPLPAPSETRWRTTPSESRSDFRAMRFPANLGGNLVKIRLHSGGTTREFTPEEFKRINPWLTMNDLIEIERY